MAAPRQPLHLAWHLAAIGLWVGLARLSGGNPIDPRSTAWYAPAALTVVLATLVGWRAVATTLAAAALDLVIARPASASLATVAAIAGATHALCYSAVGVWLRNRRVDLRDAGMRDLFHLMGAGALVAPAMVGLVHTLAARSVDIGLERPLLTNWFGWASRDAVAIVVAASLPFALTAAWNQRRPFRRIEMLHNPAADRALACVQVLLLAASVWLAFRVGDTDSHPLYIAVPALVWLAAGRGHRFAALGVALFGWGLWDAHQLAPASDPTTLRLQVMGTALLTLVVGAQVDDRRRAATAFRRMNLALQMSEARYRSVIENAADGLVVMDETGEIEIANAAIERLFGLPTGEIEGSNIATLVPPADGDVATHLDKLIRAGAPGSGERYWTGVRSDGSTFPVRIAISRIDVEGRATYTAIVQDESERHQFERQLEHQATHDGLTDLPNRTLFHDRLLAGLERLRREPGQLGLLLVDLDGFKEINDTLGHETGDRVLSETAARLRDTVRRSDTVARLGGDEFAIVVGPGIDGRAAAATAERALAAIREPYPSLPPELNPTASIGIRLVSRPDDEPVELLRHADNALYQAKHAGKDCYRFFSAPDVNLVMPDELDLRDRIEDGGLVLHYQPVLDSTTGRVTSIEALARVQLPDGSLVEPRDFIPLAERSGLIDRLGEKVLRRALMDLYELRRDIDEDLAVSVNVSARQLANRRFPDIVADAVRTAGLGPDALILEITESVDLTSVPGALELLRTIARTGVRLAIDDFGTGQTRFDLLRELPIAALKIDRSFTARTVLPGTDREIVTAIAQLAERLGIEVIAEGVESIELVDQLAALGCTQLQGFLFGRPMPRRELVPVLSGWRTVPVLARHPRRVASAQHGLGERP